MDFSLLTWIFQVGQTSFPYALRRHSSMTCRHGKTTPNQDPKEVLEQRVRSTPSCRLGVSKKTPENVQRGRVLTSMCISMDIYSIYIIYMYIFYNIHANHVYWQFICIYTCIWTLHLSLKTLLISVTWINLIIIFQLFQFNHIGCMDFP